MLLDKIVSIIFFVFFLFFAEGRNWKHETDKVGSFRETHEIPINSFPLAIFKLGLHIFAVRPCMG